MVLFELVTLEGVKFRNTVNDVQLPTATGYISVFENHAPLIALAVPGVISIRREADQPDDLMERFATNGGTIEVHDNVVRLLADEADHSDEISEVEIKKAHDEALKLRAEAKDQVSLDHAQSLIDRAAVRLKVADLKRGRRKR